MKLHFLLAALFLSALSASAGAQSAPVRPGIRQANQVERQTEKNITPPVTAPTRIDLAKVAQEADELAKIAQTIPPDVAGVQEGMLTKDVLQKLKQIERLSKRLRTDLNR